MMTEEPLSAPPPTSAAQPAPEASIVPWVAPMVIFLAVTGLEGLDSLRPFYPWVYAAKVVAVTTTVIVYRHTWRDGLWQISPVALVLGAAGLGVWIGLSELQQYLPLAVNSSGGRVGYDPHSEIINPVGRVVFVGVRLLGLAVMVPIIEEVFWRGFLWRYLIDENFTAVRPGQPSWLALAVVTGLFAVAHPEWLAAAVYALLANVLWMRSGQLAACIQMHAVTNALLGAYVLWTGQWHYW